MKFISIGISIYITYYNEFIACCSEQPVFFSMQKYICAQAVLKSHIIPMSRTRITDMIGTHSLYMLAGPIAKSRSGSEASTQYIHRL